MDRIPDLRYPGPWQFHSHRYGCPNVVTDRDGRYIATAATSRRPLHRDGRYIVSSVPAERPTARRGTAVTRDA